MNLIIIDRFKESWAVLELPDDTTFNFPRSLLPEEAKEGDVLYFEVSIDEEATRKCRSLQADLFAQAVFRDGNDRSQKTRRSRDSTSGCGKGYGRR